MEVVGLNQKAADLLKTGELEQASHLLQRVLESSSFLEDTAQALTYNNLARFYRQTNDFSAPLAYSKKAFAIEAKAKDPVNAASTLLTMASIHTSTGSFSKALGLSFKAVRMLKQRFNNKNQPLLDTLALAYFSTALAHEKLRENSKAFQVYQEAYKTLKVYKLTGMIKAALKQKVIKFQESV